MTAIDFNREYHQNRCRALEWAPDLAAAIDEIKALAICIANLKELMKGFGLVQAAITSKKLAERYVALLHRSARDGRIPPHVMNLIEDMHMVPLSATPRPAELDVLPIIAQAIIQTCDIAMYDLRAPWIEE